LARPCYSWLLTFIGVESVEEWLQAYGSMAVYLIVLIGSFVEGESVILTASALAYKYDQISLTTLMALAFMGSLCADQLSFFIGRKYGPRIIDRRQSWKDASTRVFYHLHKHGTLFILSFRFIYGIRVASPIIIGAAGVGVKRFAILNFIAAAVWSVISCSGGYLIGYFFADSIEDFIISLGRYQLYAILGIIVIAVLVGLFLHFRRKRT
jgi:membrane protein DedA with SNARE-associated domain